MSYTSISNQMLEYMREKWIILARSDNAANQSISDLRDINQCITPGYIIRRTIERQHPMYLHAHSSVDSKSTDCSWSEDTIDQVAQSLSTDFYSKKQKSFSLSNVVICGRKSHLRTRDWKRYLSDSYKTIQRDTLLEIGVELKMSEIELGKLLLSAGKDILDARNPLDLICYYVINTVDDSTSQWYRVEELMTVFLIKTNCMNTTQCTRTVSGSTDDHYDESSRRVKDEVTHIIDTFTNRHSADKEFISVLCRHVNLFVSCEITPRATNIEDFRINPNHYCVEFERGFSLDRAKKLKRFLDYLIVLYPQSVNPHQNETGIAVSFHDNKDDVIVARLINAMFRQGPRDNLPSLISLSDGGAQTSNRQFNGVLYYLQYFYDYLQKMLRVLKDETSVTAPVDRNCVLLLGYFFISGYLCCGSTDRQNAVENLARSGNSPLDDTLILIIRRLKDSLPSERASFDFLISLLDLLLSAFYFSMPTYMPLVFDRLVMMLLIDDVYRLNNRERPRTLGFQLGELIQFDIIDEYE